MLIINKNNTLVFWTNSQLQYFIASINFYKFIFCQFEVNVMRFLGSLKYVSNTIEFKFFFFFLHSINMLLVYFSVTFALHESLWTATIEYYSFKPVHVSLFTWWYIYNFFVCADQNNNIHNVCKDVYILAAKCKYRRKHNCALRDTERLKEAN